MNGAELKKLKRETQDLAPTVLARLGETLSAEGDCDTKRAKELYGILKDMLQSAEEQREKKPEPVTVRFVGETEGAAE